MNLKSFNDSPIQKTSKFSNETQKEPLCLRPLVGVIWPTVRSQPLPKIETGPGLEADTPEPVPR